MSPQRPLDQLKADSKTLWYEFSQFLAVAVRIRVGTCSDYLPVHNALVESFAIHCRVLYFFFFSPPKKDDDIVVEHYIDKKDWKSLYPEAPLILSDAKESCNKLVAHMTTMRRDLNFVPGKEHCWQVDLIEDELLKVLTTFLRHAPDDRFDPEAWADLQKMTQLWTAREQIPSANATGATGPVGPPFAREQIPSANATGATGPVGPPFAREQIPSANATGATGPGPPLGFGFWE